MCDLEINLLSLYSCVTSKAFCLSSQNFLSQIRTCCWKRINIFRARVMMNVSQFQQKSFLFTDSLFVFHMYWGTDVMLNWAWQIGCKAKIFGNKRKGIILADLSICSISCWGRFVQQWNMWTKSNLTNKRGLFSVKDAITVIEKAGHGLKLAV